MEFHLPEDYCRKAKELFQEEYEDYLSTFEREPISSLRINTLKISVGDFLRISPFELTPIPWTTDGFYVSSKDSPSTHPYYYAGLYYLQEASAMYPAEALEIEEDDLVLDCCAAPGGKSTKLLCKLKGSGLLFSNDISVTRCRALLKNMELFGGDNWFVLSEDLKDLQKDFSNTFDKILLDAPCSGEGMFHKEKGLIHSYIERGPSYYAPIQKDLILKAVSLLKEGGKLVYSTCTFSPEENEEVLQYALDHCPDLHLIPIKSYEGFSPGLYGLKEARRLYPHHLLGEGHFTACLQKGTSSSLKERSHREVSVPEDLKTVERSFTDGSFAERNEKLYFIKDHPSFSRNYRILRSGLFLGERKHGRLEYSEALALSLKKEDYPYVLSFKAEDSEVKRYLRGETLTVKDPDLPNETILICVDGYPLGFAKKDGNILKNRYPKEWRMR